MRRLALHPADNDERTDKFSEAAVKRDGCRSDVAAWRPNAVDKDAGVNDDHSKKCSGHQPAFDGDRGPAPPVISRPEPQLTHCISPRVEDCMNPDADTLRSEFQLPFLYIFRCSTRYPPPPHITPPPIPGNGRRRDGPAPLPATPASRQRSAPQRPGNGCGNGSLRADSAGWAPRRSARSAGALPSASSVGHRGDQAGGVGMQRAAEQRSAAGAVSTTRPRYSTTMRSEMWRTTARSCAMNR